MDYYVAYMESLAEKIIYLVFLRIELFQLFSDKNSRSLVASLDDLLSLAYYTLYFTSIIPICLL